MANLFLKNFKLSSGKLNQKALKEVWFVIILFLIVISILFFIFLTFLIRSGILQKYDYSILLLFRKQGEISSPIGPVWVTEMLRDITSLGSETVLTILVVIIAIFLILRKEYRTLYLILLVASGGFLVDLLLKYSFARERPDIVLHLTYVSSKSFPSGHSMMSAAIYLSLATIIARTQKNLTIRIYLITIAAILAFLIGISRVYLGVHYPSDVLAGWIAGSTWAAVCWISSRYYHKNLTGNNLSVKLPMKS